MDIKKYSIKIPGSVSTRITMAVILVQIPVIILYFYIVQNFIDNYVGEQWSSQRDELTRYIINLQEETKSIDEYLYGDCFTLLQAEDDEYLLSELTDVSEVLLENNHAFSAVSVLDKDGQDLYSLGTTQLNQDAARQYLLKHDELPDGWHLFEENEEYYMIRTAEARQKKAAALISIKQLASTASNIYHIRGTILLQRNNTYLNSTYWQRNAQEDIPGKINSPSFINSGNHRYMLCESTLLGMRVIYGCVYNYTFEWLYFFGYLLVGLACVSALVTLLYLKAYVVRPLNRMTSVIERIGNGETDLRVREENSRELQKISFTFNETVDKLRDARIESYENQLLARKAKLDALRLQIRRHFFLNSLKNIYAMASSGNLEGVKQTAYLLSSNLRYTLNFDVNSVLLEHELSMCEDYIKLQGVGQKLKPLLIIESAEELDRFMIPPVSLLTILENCCKYGLSQDHPLVIQIRTTIRQLDEKRYAIISVQDNGPGYNEEILELLNQDLEKVREKNHIGMANTMLRFKMLYGEECSALFSNNNGAKVELIIPMVPLKEEANETVDR